MIPNEHLSLWSRIQQFPLDDSTAARPFSEKLAAEQNWTQAFTKRAVAEYRRFLFLCCISPNGAAPSQPVDEVWHQHLTYTKSYWVDLCQGVLGRELHHFPSTGGPAEDAKHQRWYSETLALYRATFDEEPPDDLWPSVMTSKMLPDLPRFNWNSKEGAAVAMLIILPFLFSGISYGTSSPFALGGPHFLVFFALFSLALAGSWVIIKLTLRQSLLQAIDEHFPADASPFQIADCIYGKHRALQTAIVDLIQRNGLEISEGNRFRVKKNFFAPHTDRETNPLVAALMAEEEGSLHSYEDLGDQSFRRDLFTIDGAARSTRFVIRSRNHPEEDNGLVYAAADAVWGSGSDSPPLRVGREKCYFRFCGGRLAGKPVCRGAAGEWRWRNTGGQREQLQRWKQLWVKLWRRWWMRRVQRELMGMS